MVRILPLAALAILISGCTSEELTAPMTDPAISTDPSVTRTRSRQVFPLEAPLINECYNGGTPESIRLFGSIVLIIQSVSHLSGEYVEVLHVRTQGVHGIGLTSGIRYGVMEHQSTVTKVNENGSESVLFVFSIRIIGAGAGNNELLTSRSRLIVSPDGTPTFVFDKTDHTCH